MANPFEKRATEYFREDEGFLPLVSPDPLATFFQKPAEEERLYDRLSVVIGTPGSGKTTLARLFEFGTLSSLLGNREMTNYRPLVDRMVACRAIDDESPTVIGARLPMGSEYRDFWELPYSDELKTGLMIELLQARAVLAWLRNAVASGVELAEVELVPRADAEAALTEIGGVAGPAVLERARTVERAIYRISAALIPPPVEDIDREASAAYHPFDVIDTFRFKDRRTSLSLRPLIIFDDAHTLHPDQLVALWRWLAQRELKVARWILTRLDALRPADVILGHATNGDASAVNQSREITIIRMQRSDDRAKQRRDFRKMARDMAGRYMNQMEVFSRRGLLSLSDLLPNSPPLLAAGKVQQLKNQVDALQVQCGVSTRRRNALEKLANDYLTANCPGSGSELQLAILAVLFERYGNRSQPSLFIDEQETIELRRPLKVDAGVVDGARIHLLHKYQLPYFFGFDTLANASSENAEQFLQLAARLVSQAETQLIRGRSATIPTALQHRLLRERAKQMVDEWNFPQCQYVRRLADRIARECITKSREGNAPLGGGATAFGIPQDEFNTIPTHLPHLAQVLQFGIAYNAYVLVPNYGTKKRLWCLIELSGVLRLKYGLTLKRGGFLERRLDDLLHIIEVA